MEAITNLFSGGNGLIAIVVAIVILWLVFKVARRLFKTVLSIVVIAFIGLLVYSMLTGKKMDDVVNSGFENYLTKHPISTLMTDKCQGEKAEKFMCQCIYGPIHQDMTYKYSTTQLNSLESDKSKKKEAVMTSFRNQKANIKACIKEKRKAGTGKLMDSALKFIDNLDRKSETNVR